jgi:hypothetical protein
LSGLREELTLVVLSRDEPSLVELSLLELSFEAVSVDELPLGELSFEPSDLDLSSFFESLLPLSELGAWDLLA